MCSRNRKICFNEEQVKKVKNYFVRQDDVSFALVFGSVATGRDTPISDIDIAVYFKEKKEALRLGERQIDCICALMRICKFSKVDVVVLNLANPFLGFQVIKYGRLIYAEDVRVFYKFKAAALGRYQDIRQMYDLYDRAAETNLRRGGYG